MGKVSGLGLGEIKKVSGLGLGAIKKISGLGLGVIWSAFAPAGMVHSGAAVSLSTTLTQIGGWVAEAGSVVTGGNALIASGSGSGTITSSVPFTNSGINRTVDIEIRVNGATVASVTGASVPGGGATITLNTTGSVAIPDGAQITYWARQSGGTLQVANSAAAYVRITPA